MKILVYNPKFGHSNVSFFGNIADIIVDTGHDVTTLLPEIDPSLGDGTTKSKKIYVPQADELKPKTKKFLKKFEFDWLGSNELDPIEPFFCRNALNDRFVFQCRRTLEEPGLIDRLREEQFDVMITENFDMCGIGLSHLIKPGVLINGAASVPLALMTEEFGLPKSWIYNPSPLISHLDVHSFWSRLKNLYAEAILYRTFYTSRSSVEAVFRDKYGASFPSFAACDVSNLHVEDQVDFATPTLSRIVYVGGLGANEPMELDKKFEEILNLRSKTIIITFGSVVQSWQLKEHEKMSLVEETNLRAPNLHLFKWIPQNDLLADNRVTAFITHAGMASVQEMIIRGKPGLFIPIFGDQPRNAGMLEQSGLGKVFDRRHFAESAVLITAIEDLLVNQRYYENARRIAAMIAKKPLSSKELLIKTIEFAGEFGPVPALRPQSYDMSWIAYHNLDIIAFLGLIVAIIALAGIATIGIGIGIANWYRHC